MTSLVGRALRRRRCADTAKHIDPEWISSTAPSLPAADGPIRLADPRADPRSVGFPAHHPEMRSFLVVPVRLGNRRFGNLYLTEKEGGGYFDAEDERLVVTLGGRAGPDGRARGRPSRRPDRPGAASAGPRKPVSGCCRPSGSRSRAVPGEGSHCRMSSGARWPLTSPSMRFCGRRLSGFSGLTLGLALAGLLLMHGFDAGAVTGGGIDGHVTSSMVRHAMAPAAGASQPSGAMSESAYSDGARSTGDVGHIRVAATDAAGGHAGIGHVVAMCMAVLAAASTGAVRRLVGGVRARLTAATALAAGRLVRAVEVGRPSGPGRLELCILRC